MRKLIADAGGTKTEWLLIEDGKLEKRFATGGLNPSVTGLGDFALALAGELLPQTAELRIDETEFYGAGCTDDMIPEVEKILARFFPAAKNRAGSDLLGACRALCKDGEGVAAILGTGSNSCLYDGRRIVKHIPPLGFILGDEGSGAALGKLFLGALLKGRLSREVGKAFSDETGLEERDIIRRVYREARPNAFLASVAPFVRTWREDETVRGVIMENFRAFFSRNILPYGRPDLPVNMVGGIACNFLPEIRECARAEGLSIGKVLPSPAVAFAGG